MQIPNSFKITDGGLEYEIYVESTSCTGARSADILIIKKAAPEESSQADIPVGVPLAGAAFALFGGLVSRIKGRRPEPEDGKGIVLSPKRNH
ncbi:MAG: hypothetical protein AB1657_00700 [Candidatus Micrarchaeota archaeon]